MSWRVKRSHSDTTIGGTGGLWLQTFVFFIDRCRNNELVIKETEHVRFETFETRQQARASLFNHIEVFTIVRENIQRLVCNHLFSLKNSMLQWGIRVFRGSYERSFVLQIAGMTLLFIAGSRPAIAQKYH